MKQSVFNDKLITYIGKTAHKKNIDITANAIYFMSKQHFTNKVHTKTYTIILKTVRKYLIENCGWEITQIHDCFCKLKSLSQSF